MAMTGVLRPGHAQVRVLDLEESVRFYRDVLGLVETGRDTAGRVYFKAWDERDHHSLILREADRAGARNENFRTGSHLPALPLSVPGRTVLVGLRVSRQGGEFYRCRRNVIRSCCLVQGREGIVSAHFRESQCFCVRCSLMLRSSPGPAPC